MTDTLSLRPINTPAENGNAANGSAPASTPTPRLYPLSALLPDFCADAAAAHEARITGKPRGPISGLETIDKELAGAFSPGIHGIHGNAGAGKTAFGLQIASSCQCPALLVTCEMAPVELLRRLTARITGTYLGRLKSGEMPPDAAEALARQTIEALPMLAICDATTAPATPEYLLQAATATRRDAQHFLMLVDSLHSWAGALTATLDTATEYETLNTGVAALQSLAARLRAPVLFIAERNRATMKDGGLNAGAGTRKIEYAGETVLSLDREIDAPENGAGEVAIKLRFSKNRNGAAGKTVALQFNGALQRFTETNAGGVA
jgi:replicative DNA helicase